MCVDIKYIHILLKHTWNIPKTVHVLTQRKSSQILKFLIKQTLDRPHSLITMQYDQHEIERKHKSKNNPTGF